MKRPATTPGRLRHRLVLETPQATPDGGGGEIVTWTVVTTLWADIAPVSAAERQAAGHLEAAVSHTIRIRHRTDVGGNQRFSYGARIFRIRAVLDPDETRRFLTCFVEETAE